MLKYFFTILLGIFLCLPLSAQKAQADVWVVFTSMDSTRDYMLTSSKGNVYSDAFLKLWGTPAHEDGKGQIWQGRAVQGIEGILTFHLTHGLWKNTDKTALYKPVNMKTKSATIEKHLKNGWLYAYRLEISNEAHTKAVNNSQDNQLMLEELNKILR